VNANPSGSRTLPTGSWGRSIARREFATTTEPPSSRLQTLGRAGAFGPFHRQATGAAAVRVMPRRRGVGPRIRGSLPKEGTGKTIIPVTSIISSYSHFPWRTGLLPQAWSVDLSPIEVGTSSGMSGRTQASPRDQGPSPKIMSRLRASAGRTTPSWHSRCAASPRRLWMGPPEGKES
jgi:hypothetical protein